jgi:hypothetical protein
LASCVDTLITPMVHASLMVSVFTTQLSNRDARHQPLWNDLGSLFSSKLTSGHQSRQVQSMRRGSTVSLTLKSAEDSGSSEDPRTRHAHYAGQHLHGSSR